MIVDSRDFIRILIKDKLKIDLVNDRIFHRGSNLFYNNAIKIDNVENILSNKLCAIISRDEPKDIFDLCCIFQKETIDWISIISDCNKKCILDKEILEYRLKSFPVTLFDLLPITDSQFLKELKENYPSIIRNITNSII